jgi:hypothetical protein
MYDGQSPERWREWRLKSVVDVKAKSSPSWLGIFNLRHLAHYAHWSDVYDVPVVVYFALVDDDDQSVGREVFVCPIEPWDNYEDYVEHYNRDSNTFIDTVDIADDCPYVARTFGADDGNPVVVVDESNRYDVDWLLRAMNDDS